MPRESQSCLQCCYLIMAVANQKALVTFASTEIYFISLRLYISYSVFLLLFSVLFVIKIYSLYKRTTFRPFNCHFKFGRRIKLHP